MSRISRVPLTFVFVLTLLSALWPATAHAQRRHGHGSVVVVGGYFYDPFYFGAYQYPYPYPYPYGYPPYRYPFAIDRTADIRLQVTPKSAAVYVDGYYAGIVDDFDGVFQRLHVQPGAHEITLYLKGYRTYKEQRYLTPESSYRMHYAMAPLAPGEVQDPVPAPSAPPNIAPPPGARMPRMPGVPRTPAEPPAPPSPPPPSEALPPPPPEEPPAPPSGETSRFGTVAIRVQPEGSEIHIDGEQWRGPDTEERLIVQLSEGRHHVEIRKDGYQPFSTDIDVRRGETVPLNVSLPKQP